MKSVFEENGLVFRVMDFLGKLIVLSCLWLLGCLPIVTICTSNAALYYAVAKTIRGGQGNAVGEFWRSYRLNLVKGIGMTLCLIAVFGLLGYLMVTFQSGGYPSGGILSGFIFIGFTAVYLGPVLSRFSLGFWKLIKLSFVMSLQFAHYTLLFLLGSLLLFVLQFFLLPMALIFLLPGLWCWLTVPLMEKAMRKYMPERTGAVDEWYYEN